MIETKTKLQKSVEENQQESIVIPETKKSHEEQLLRMLNSADNVGGFKLLKNLVKGIDNLDPKRRAQRNTFKTEDTYKSERKRIASEIAIWLEILEKGDNPSELLEYCKEEVELAEDSLTANMSQLREELRPLEVTYNTLKSFFENASAEDEDIRHLNLINVDKTKLEDYNSEDTQAIINEIEKNYDKLGLQDSYSLLVMPGYLGSPVNVRFWAKHAHNSKVLLITDFEDCYSFSDLNLILRKASLQDSDIELSNVVMACNYVIARKKSQLADEDSDLYIPASAAIAGRMSDVTTTMISQGIAGVKHGALNYVLGTRFEMRKSEISLLIENGVVPVVEENGRTMAFSNQSLYVGDRFGLQEYPVVRVIDWIGKVIQNYCNGRAFNVWSFAERNEIQEALIEFLNECKFCHLFEKYNLKDVRQDPTTLNIIIQLEILPNLAAKNFLIELTGLKKDNFMSWDQKL